MTADPVTVSRNARDAAAANAVVAHHGAMTDRVSGLLAEVVQAVDARSDVLAPREALVAYFRDEVMPHALAEESTMYRAVADDLSGRLLIGSMIEEHGRIKAMIDGLARAVDAGAVAAAAGGLEALFAAHVDKENNVIVPLLSTSGSASLADLVEGLHVLVGDSDSPHGVAGGSGRGCGCGCGCGGGH